MGSPSISYSPRPETTPEAELNALTAVYALALQKYQESKKTEGPAPEPDGRDDVRKSEDAHTANQIIPR